MFQAFVSVAGHIMSGFYDVGISGGVESMSTTDMSSSVPDVNWEKVADCPLGFLFILSSSFMSYFYRSYPFIVVLLAQDCTVPMGITSENVAEKYQITRREQDEVIPYFLS